MGEGRGARGEGQITLENDVHDHRGNTMALSLFLL